MMLGGGLVVVVVEGMVKLRTEVGGGRKGFDGCVVVVVYVCICELGNGLHVGAAYRGGGKPCESPPPPLWRVWWWIGVATVYLGAVHRGRDGTSKCVSGCRGVWSRSHPVFCRFSVQHYPLQLSWATAK